MFDYDRLGEVSFRMLKLVELGKLSKKLELDSRFPQKYCCVPILDLSCLQ